MATGHDWTDALGNHGEGVVECRNCGDIANGILGTAPQCPGGIREVFQPECTDPRCCPQIDTAQELAYEDETARRLGL